jgi:5'-nucleotidase
MSYKWILFDIDDTLLDFGYAARKAFTSMLAHLEIAEESHYYESYQVCNHAAWAALEAGKINAEQLRRQRFADFQEAVGLVGTLDPAAMNALFLEHVIWHTLPVPGAAELLAHLQSRVGMGVITNGLREVQRPRIQKAGMEPYFSAIVVSDEIGLAKPDPLFFAYAHEAIGLPPKEQVLVVGDSLVSDIRGGMDYGFAACWFNPGRKPNPTGTAMTYEVDGLEQVSALLG